MLFAARISEPLVFDVINYSFIQVYITASFRKGHLFFIIGSCPDKRFLGFFGLSRFQPKNTIVGNTVSHIEMKLFSVPIPLKSYKLVKHPSFSSGDIISSRILKYL